MLETTQNVPLVLTQDGTIRVANTRVTLESLIHQYRDGASAEEIALRFPDLQLSDIHAVLAYYLTHLKEVDDYLSAQECDAESIHNQITSNPSYQKTIADLRERIKNRSTIQTPQSP